MRICFCSSPVESQIHDGSEHLSVLSKHDTCLITGWNQAWYVNSREGLPLVRLENARVPGVQEPKREDREVPDVFLDRD